jgi:hypothetical protein
MTWMHRISAIVLIAGASYLQLHVPFPAGPIAIAVTVTWLTLAVFVTLRLFQLKTVDIDGDDLVISNFGPETRVPLKEVAKISGSRGGKGAIKLTFRNPTDAGQRIYFRPPRYFGLLLPWQPHPLVNELKQLCGLTAKPDVGGE